MTGSKEVRAEPFAAQVQGGNVSMLAGSWQTDLLDEMECFPTANIAIRSTRVAVRLTV